MKHQFQKGFTVTELVVLVVLISILFVIFTGYRTRGGKGHERTRAVGHLTQVKLALEHFKNDYGVYPGQEIVDKSRISGAKATTANDCYRQLIQGLPELKTVAIFYAFSRISRKPDDDIGDQFNLYSRACAKGEVGFLYVDSPASTSQAPVAAAPLYNTSGTFDYDTYNGKAVVLLKDGSIQTYTIDKKSGKIIADINQDGKKNRHFLTIKSSIR